MKKDISQIVNSHMLNFNNTTLNDVNMYEVARAI